MAKVMLRQKGETIYFYVAKKDMEETIKAIEFDSEEKFGGKITLNNGEEWFIDPAPKKLPSEVNAKRLSE
ncbi:MAG: putative nitrogen fixation protein NifT [Helicobacteraceae bacterium]|jgi:nitrogen fixation protein NifT|nr:putative nitrogen fixation protein NifT [Helicobacteraceae bacterium]